jgi:hypothetical protein
MKAWIPLTLVFALGFTAHAWADCSKPASPNAPPDGNTATKDEMVAAAQNFKAYNTDMNKYLDCLKVEMDSAPKDVTKLTPKEKQELQQQQNALTQKNNAAVDELQAAVGKFNEQLRIYKAKHTP